MSYDCTSAPKSGQHSETLFLKKIKNCRAHQSDVHLFMTFLFFFFLFPLLKQRKLLEESLSFPA